MAITLCGKPASCGVSNKSREETIPVYKPMQIGGIDTENMAVWIGWDDRMGRTPNQSRSCSHTTWFNPTGSVPRRSTPLLHGQLDERETGM
jgi:hypothetical protein